MVGEVFVPVNEAILGLIAREINSDSMARIDVSQSVCQRLIKYLPTAFDVLTSGVWAQFESVNHPTMPPINVTSL
jgi:hypothetical protein